MPETKETVMDWLRDAHAMESSIVSLLERQVKQLDDRPDVKGKMQEHLNLTRAQGERLKGLIEQMGGDVSTVKETTGKVMSNIQALTAGMAPDSIVKNAIANFAVEHFEIASYKSLIAAAEAQGLPDVKRVCQEILDEEQEMASWLAHHIPRLTNEYLGQQATKRA